MSRIQVIAKNVNWQQWESSAAMGVLGTISTAILNFEVVAVIVEQKYNASRISLKTPISTAILKFEVVAKIVERK